MLNNFEYISSISGGPEPFTWQFLWNSHGLRYRKKKHWISNKHASVCC